MMTDILLPEIRNYLDITWEDPAQDKNLLMYIEWGISRISALCGAKTEDFTENSAAKEILFDYVRYAFNHSLEDFERNFQNKINTLRIYNQTRE
ncbi:MAG: hypothetical protein FWG44_06990 [Oscillospiraceae bacterium]|nr:hypothetical protein [Oscillospiraceae bacterium]